MSIPTKQTVRTDLAAEILAEAIPGWSDLRDTAHLLRSEIISRQAQRPEPRQERLAVSEALREAKDPESVQEALNHARLDKYRRDEEQTDLDNLSLARDSAESQLAELERGSIHETTDVIRERVEAITDDIRALKRRPLSAQEAIDTDAANEWQQLQQLTRDWQALVRAYMTLTRAAMDGPGLSVLASAAFVTDPLGVHPHFIGRRAAAGARNDRPRPDSFHEAMLRWSQDAPATRFDTDAPRGGQAHPNGADPIRWVVHLVENDAMTVHEPGEAHELWNAAVAATDDITANSAQSRAVARVEYAKLTGDDQLETVEDLRPLVEQGKRRPARGAFFG